MLNSHWLVCAIVEKVSRLLTHGTMYHTILQYAVPEHPFNFASNYC